MRVDVSVVMEMSCRIQSVLILEYALVRLILSSFVLYKIEYFFMFDVYVPLIESLSST